MEIDGENRSFDNCKDPHIQAIEAENDGFISDRLTAGKVDAAIRLITRRDKPAGRCGIERAAASVAVATRRDAAVLVVLFFRERAILARMTREVVEGRNSIETVAMTVHLGTRESDDPEEGHRLGSK